MTTETITSASASRPGSASRRKRLVVVGTIAIAAVAGLTVMIVLLVNRDNGSSTTSGEKSSSTVSGPTRSPAPTTSAPVVITNPPTTTTFDPPTSMPSAMPSSIPPTTMPPTSLPTGTSTTADSSIGQIISGQAGGIDYYHCRPAAPTLDVVLLHGSSFTKEVWINPRRMIFQNFCQDVSVTALDLAVSSRNTQLRQVLDALQTDKVLATGTPVVLVTPSASGLTMVDWMMNGNVQLIPQYVSTWVPVATPSLRDASDAQVASLASLNGLSVLAIHGDQDTAASRYLERLETLAGATLVELIGGHAVYLGSPDEFVQTILEYEGIR